MKEKTILTFQCEEKRFWSRETGERRKANFVLIARIPDEEDSLYASTVESEIEHRFGENVQADIERLAIKKEKEKKYLEITWNNGEQTRLYKEDFVVLFITPDSSGEDNDNMLVFNFPGYLHSSLHKYYFHLDKKDGTAVAIFWMLKECF